MIMPQCLIQVGMVLCGAAIGGIIFLVFINLGINSVIKDWRQDCEDKNTHQEK